MKLRKTNPTIRDRSYSPVGSLGRVFEYSTDYVLLKRKSGTINVRTAQVASTTPLAKGLLEKNFIDFGNTQRAKGRYSDWWFVCK